MKRKWFQIHLSTAIMLTLIAGLFLYPNIKGQEIYVTVGYSSPKIGALESHLQYGWPLPLLEPTVGNHDGWSLGGPALPVHLSVSITGLLVDGSFLIFIMFCSSFIFEYFIRREARKP
jgi:hypothetical protein